MQAPGPLLLRLAGTRCATYLQALVCVTVSMSFEPFKPPTCDHHLFPTMCDKTSVPQRVFFYGSLYLMALGAGGIKACVTAFSADQFDDTDLGQKHERVSFMNWWWFSLSVERIMGSVAFFPWVQEQYGWVWIGAIPAGIFHSMLWKKWNVAELPAAWIHRCRTL